MRTAAVLPVKRFDRAKQRLAQGVPVAVRLALAEAMLTDVLAALARVRRLEAVIVVSGDPRARALGESRAAVVVTDPGDAGQSAAAELGLQRARELGYERALLVPGDCPALDARELDALLARAAAPPALTIVPDRHGTGTNALLLDPDSPVRPAFGPGSLERHVASAVQAGIEFAVEPLPSLVLDVDTPADLSVLRDALASRPPAAPATRAALEQLLDATVAP